MVYENDKKDKNRLEVENIESEEEKCVTLKITNMH